MGESERERARARARARERERERGSDRDKVPTLKNVMVEPPGMVPYLEICHGGTTSKRESVPYLKKWWNHLRWYLTLKNVMVEPPAIIHYLEKCQPHLEKCHGEPLP